MNDTYQDHEKPKTWVDIEEEIIDFITDENDIMLTEEVEEVITYLRRHYKVPEEK